MKKEDWILVFMLMLIGMIFEIFSIGALVPLFTVFSNPDNYSQYAFLEGLTQKEIIIYLTVGIFLIFPLKQLFLQLKAKISSKIFISNHGKNFF